MLDAIDVDNDGDVIIEDWRCDYNTSRPTPPTASSPHRVRSTVDLDPSTPSRIATGPPNGSPLTLIETFNQLPVRLRRTLTWDQGNEMFHHQRIETEAGLKIYFADPHSPWQRGSNENANGLVRQHLPKGTDFSLWDDEQLRQIADELNDRPRLCLKDNTPTELLRRWERQYALH